MPRPSNADLKRRLHRTFPATAFSVTSGRGTAASWTHVRWTDGPSSSRVVESLAAVGAAPGTMDNTDYFNGERISTHRDISDAHRQRVATLLLAPKPVPEAATWDRSICLPHRGYVDFQNLVQCASGHREQWDRYRFEAHCWLDAITLGLRTARSYTCYDRMPSLEGV